MAYCSQTQLEDLYTIALIESLTDDAGAGSIDADKVTAAITDAGREIDGYCRAKYSVPMSPTPPMVAAIAMDLTMWRLYRRRAQSFGMPEHVQEAYTMRIRQLEMVNQGKLDLGVEPPTTPTTKLQVESQGPEQLFKDGDDDDTLDGF